MANELTFTLFADLHYKTGMYATAVSDLDTILRRASADGSAFVLHCGDFCNDYAGSPELWRLWLDNPYGLSVYGVYGNHELESHGNTMALVTPKLNNAPVVWGTEDGTIGDGSIAYWYFDRDGFRIIGVDTNYSYDPTAQVWEHNHPASWGYPPENKRGDSLSPRQLAWLERVLNDAADNDLRCIVVGHDGFSGRWDTSSDAEVVRALYRRVNDRCLGTVVLSLNGHMHTDHNACIDGVVYVDVNTVINGCWLPQAIPHYKPEHTFRAVDYDDDGHPVCEETRPLTALWMSPNTWYFTEPLSTSVTVTRDGRVTVGGMQTAWVYGIEPPDENAVPYISPCKY